ncbi:MAG: serine hydrolase domain-containing protein [Owenweeksia sp.]
MNVFIKKVLPLITVMAISCSSPQEKDRFEELLEYEGRYEYVGGQTLDLVASEMDTTLYAVLNRAKYPLKYIEPNQFRDVQKSLVVFKRNEQNKVAGYKVDGLEFKLLTRDFERTQMIPRKEWLDPEAYIYQQPEETEDALQTAHLKEVFMDPEPIKQMVRHTIQGNFPEVHSILIYKNNKLVLEEYFYGYDRNTPHQLRSATKPFIGAMLGLSIDQGYIESEEEKLLPFFEQKYPDIQNVDERKEQLTIRDFLKYRHGMDCENNNPESLGNEQAMMQSEDWVKYTLDLPMVSAPGKSSSYCTGCPMVLGRLVEISTGEDIETFARRHLFHPLGIESYRWDFEPNASGLHSYNMMELRPRDLLKLAKMYLDGGKWKGKQVLSESWVSKTFDTEPGDYGYLWEHKYFIVDGVQYDSYMASGNGGQKINIWPEYDMITVFTGGNYNSYQLYGESTPPNRMIPDYILKALSAPR